MSQSSRILLAAIATSSLIGLVWGVAPPTDSSLPPYRCLTEDPPRKTFERLAVSVKGEVALFRYPEVTVWNLRTGKRHHSFQVRGGVNSLLFSPDGGSLIVNEERNPHVRDLATGKVIDHIPRRMNTLSPNGHILVGYERESLPRFDLRSRKTLPDWKPPHPALMPQSWGFSQDNRYFATAGWREVELSQTIGGGVHLWDARTDQLVQELRGGDDLRVTSFDFSPDGFRLTCVVKQRMSSDEVQAQREDRRRFLLELMHGDGYKYYLRQWEVVSGQEIYQFRFESKAHAEFVQSPDGRVLASPGVEPKPDEHSIQMRLRDARTGRIIHEWDTRSRNSWPSTAFAHDGKTLITAESQVLAWDISRFVPRDKPLTHTDKELALLWDDLASRDIAAARAAVWKLAASPRQTVPLFADKLKAIPKLGDRTVATLIATLSSDDAKQRNDASAKLELQGTAVAAAVRAALKKPTSLEAQRRLESLARGFQRPIRSLDKQRSVRAIEVLEHIGTEDARKLLRRLAAGAPGALETDEAAASLARQAKKPPAER